MRSLSYLGGVQLSTTYRTLQGDTFEIISRRRYGTEMGADNIRAANPGVTEPMLAGLDIIIPPVPGAPADRSTDTEASSLSEVTLLVGGLEFRHWSEVHIVMSVDSLDTVAFAAPFDVGIPGFKETFKPFAFQSVGVDVGGRRLFTGTMMSVNPEITKSSKMVRGNAYSLPGVLNDCTAPSSLYTESLGFHGQNLRDIARTVAKPFGIGVVFDDDPGPAYGFTFSFSDPGEEAPVLKPGQKILSFLVGLAKERGFLITNTPEGELYFREADVGAASVATLRQGRSPLISVTPQFNAQEYYSHITAKAPTFFGMGGENVVAVNPRLNGVLRPFTYNPADGVIGADVQVAVDAKMGRMFANAAPYTATVSTWRTPAGGLWQAGDTVTVHAPDAMIYEPYEFVIRQVTLVRSAKQETATLNLVLPGSLASKSPKGMPWDESA